MADFTITLTDPTHLAGITSARLAHNAALPDDHIPTDAEYVQFVMARAAESYANQYPQG